MPINTRSKSKAQGTSDVNKTLSRSRSSSSSRSSKTKTEAKTNPKTKTKTQKAPTKRGTSSKTKKKTKVKEEDNESKSKIDKEKEKGKDKDKNKDNGKDGPDVSIVISAPTHNANKITYSQYAIYTINAGTDPIFYNFAVQAILVALKYNNKDLCRGMINNTWLEQSPSFSNPATDNTLFLVVGNKKECKSINLFKGAGQYFAHYPILGFAFGSILYWGNVERIKSKQITPKIKKSATDDFVPDCKSWAEKTTTKEARKEVAFQIDSVCSSRPGIGNVLLKHLEKYAKKEYPRISYLYVEALEEAEPFYKKQGFGPTNWPKWFSKKIL